MKSFRGVLLLNAITILGALVYVGIAQAAADAGSSSIITISFSPGQRVQKLNLAYTRATEKTKLRNYFVDTLGPPQSRGRDLGGL
jgi:hypothetical protein